MFTNIAFVLMAGVASLNPVLAQQFVISTYAGGAPPPTPFAAVNAAIGNPLGVTTDSAGNVFFVSNLHCIFKIDPEGTLTRIAGTCRQGYSGDGGPAINAQISIPDYDDYGFSNGPAIDSLDNLYFADNHRVRKVSPTGIITTVAGNGTSGFSGDGGLASDALLSPQSVAVDRAGNLYIADIGSNRVRKVSAEGIISTIAGTGTYGFSGDGGAATSAQISAPGSLAVDTEGNLYISGFESTPHVRKVSPDGIITTVAGGGYTGRVPEPDSGDGGPATSAPLSIVTGLAADSAGNLYILDARNSRVRRVSPDGIITTAAGSGHYGFSGDGGPATSAQISQYAVLNGLAVDLAGNLYIGDATRIRKVAADGVITTVAGNADWRYSGDGGPATTAQVNFLTGAAADPVGNLYIGDGNRVRKVSPDGIITTVAGNGTYGFSGDGGPATSAKIVADALAVDSAGNIYIADHDNMHVRRVSAGGSIATVAGNGSRGYSGDGGPATDAQLGYPSGLAVDNLGNLYITIAAPDVPTGIIANYSVRKVSPAGIITTVAGNGTIGFSGDGGPATRAQLDNPTGLTVDEIGNLYIADSGNGRVRKISPAGIISTVAGNGAQGYSGDGDGGLATGVPLSLRSLAVNSTGNLYIVETGNPRVRMVFPSGIITTVAGNGSQGYSGDGGSATNAQFGPWCFLTLDGAGNLYLADQYYGAVRLLQPARLEKTP